MKFYTCYACTDGLEKWLVIDQLPAMQGEYVNEVARQRFTRQGLIVVCIITDKSISWDDARGLLTSAFDNPRTWHTVNLKKTVTLQGDTRDNRRGR